MKDLAIILPLLASVVTVAGQLLYKHSARVKGEGSGKARWLSLLMAGNVLFLSAVVFNFFAMKFISLFIVYSFTALNYVFVTIASGFILREPVGRRNVLASFLIALGVFLISSKF